MRPFLLPAVVLVSLGGCSLPPPDQPAHYMRMGRFVGLVARCGCSDLSAERVLSDYPHAVAVTHSPRDIARMRPFIELAAAEQFDNQAEICAEVCSQSCMVNAVAGPLGGRTTPDLPACLVSERDLHLTAGYTERY